MDGGIGGGHSMKDALPDQSQQQRAARMNLADYRNSDYVNKLMAATPPYLFAATTGTHNFFFSDLLRSLCEAKKHEMANMRCSEATLPPQLSRRPRKRSWSQHRPPAVPPPAPPPSLSEDKVVDRPLELTSKNSAFTPNFKAVEREIEKKISRLDSIAADEAASSGEASTSSVSDLVLPPPPPVWYPPLYPPYGIDPLHFFIDLRVSGHIYDRKRELAAQALKANNNNLPSFFDSELFGGSGGAGGKGRAGSAFSIPRPKSKEGEVAFDGESGEREKENKVKGATAYVMQNLPKIYGDLQKPTLDDIVEERRELGEEKPRKLFDNGISVYNVETDEEDEKKFSASDEETIAVDEN